MASILKKPVRFLRSKLDTVCVQAGAASYLITQRRLPQHSVIEKFCEGLGEILKTIAESYDYDCVLDKPDTTLTKKGSSSSLIITLQHKERLEKKHSVDLLIGNFRTKFLIKATLREHDLETIALCDGPIDYHIARRPTKFVPVMIDIADTVLNHFLDEKTQEKLAATRSGQVASFSPLMPGLNKS